MEEWQIKHITQNLPELIPLTNFNVLLKAELVAKNILSKADIDSLDAVQTQRGQSDTSYQYYQRLMGRTNAYKVLSKALIKNRQTGAARILIDGVPREVSDKPLTYLDIPINLNGFKDMEVEVNGKKLTLHKFLPNVNYEKLQQVFKDTVCELEIYDTFVMKSRTFVLANNTVPPKAPFYIPRFLSNRIKINESIFKTECSDVFVFKNTITRYKLSDIANPHFTDTSTSQLSNITSRFIYLDESEDWIELKKTCSKIPIHLVNYEADDNHFLLEDSSAPSDMLGKLGSHEKRAYISEDQFVTQQLSQDYRSSTVCICDTPGMGKTYLLANIARLMADRCNARIVVFISLAEFFGKFFPGSPNTILQPEASLINVLRYIYPTRQNTKLLLQLVKAKLLLVEVFFDGFDEISEDKVEWTKKMFRTLTSFTNVKIYISSRPHMRQELEKNLGVVAYDILPFNQQNQVDFLVQFWIKKGSDSDKPFLQSYATTCLKAVNLSLTKKDKDIAGIPLLCQLIAEIYANKGVMRSTKSFCDVPLKISGMYQNYIDNKINIVANNKKEFDDIKLLHIMHALKLLFPESDFHEDNLFENMKDLLTSAQILKMGILKKHSNTDSEFIHRTFAEYLAGEYFVAKLQDNEMSNTDQTNCSSMSILKILFKLQLTRKKYFPYEDYFDFVHLVIVSFFNSALGENNISAEIKIQTATFISSISSYEFNRILGGCCRHNLFNIFLLLRESLKKWDNVRILELFSIRNSYEVLRICIRESTTHMFHSCIQLLTEELQVGLSQINTFHNNKTLLQMAVEFVNYEAVEYFGDRLSLKNQSILECCVENSFTDTEKTLNIMNLLHNKDPTLIYETPEILLKCRTDARIFKTLVEFGANLYAVNKNCGNCAMFAADFMSPSDYYELVKFLLTDYKAHYLFVDDEKWKDPLPEIIKRAILLPETLELLLNIPGNGINMKSKNGENLLFSAVKGNKVDNFQQLVDRGLDYNAMGFKNRNMNVLHLAAEWKGVDMVRYLLSLKLDSNSRDENQWTPLHYGVYFQKYALDVVGVLVENGANVQAKNNKGQHALHLAAYSDSPSTQVIKYLIRNGARVNDRDNDGNTPLHLCRSKIIRDCLIEMGADIHAKHKIGQVQTLLNSFFGKRSK